MVHDSMDVVEALRELARECSQISAEIEEPLDAVNRLASLSFMIRYIADSLEHEFQLAADRGKKE